MQFGKTVGTVGARLISLSLDAVAIHLHVFISQAEKLAQSVSG